MKTYKISITDLTIEAEDKLKAVDKFRDRIMNIDTGYKLGQYIIEEVKKDCE